MKTRCLRNSVAVLVKPDIDDELEQGQAAGIVYCQGEDVDEVNECRSLYIRSDPFIQYVCRLSVFQHILSLSLAAHSDFRHTNNGSNMWGNVQLTDVTPGLRKLSSC